MVPDNLEFQLKEIISKVVEMEPEKILPDADFMNDLGIDSLKAIEITGAIEKAFRVVVPEEQIRNIRTLNQALALTKQLLEDKD
ncbi:MAG: acyl carrier protein [Candidatus Omnitrophica bacterium]|nr:acyl carrier protein [Candidatus Omnitrophota bacterium]MBU2045046.1 acyl carrier protein [Candidatus Omnitrophota bacterium]